MFLPLKMSLRPSRILLLILTLLHGLAAWAVTLTVLPVTVKVALFALLVCSMAWQGWLYRSFYAGQRIRAVRVDTKNSLWLDGLGQESQHAELRNAWLGPGFGVAAIKSKGRVHHLVWMPDSADRQVLRRWRVWLRWKNS
jgi:hypothetical protein